MDRPARAASTACSAWRSCASRGEDRVDRSRPASFAPSIISERSSVGADVVRGEEQVRHLRQGGLGSVAPIPWCSRQRLEVRVRRARIRRDDVGVGNQSNSMLSRSTSVALFRDALSCAPDLVGDLLLGARLRRLALRGVFPWWSNRRCPPTGSHSPCQRQISRSRRPARIAAAVRSATTGESITIRCPWMSGRSSAW